MRKRDLGILILCAFAIFFSLRHEGDFSFREAWFHLSDEYPIKYEGERLPPPIVVDLNGDGRKEVLVATHDAKIQVLEPHSQRVDEGFSEARMLTEVSLLPEKVRISSGRRAVAMATGVIERTYKPGQPQKQVLVVVTTGWSVMCFGHWCYRGFDGCVNGVKHRGFVRTSLCRHLEDKHLMPGEGDFVCRERIRENEVVFSSGESILHQLKFWLCTICMKTHTWRSPCKNHPDIINQIQEERQVAARHKAKSPYLLNVLLATQRIRFGYCYFKLYCTDKHIDTVICI